MEKLTALTGVAVPLRRSNVDTDQIIPAVFLKRVQKSGFDDALFYAWRRDPEFVLNQPEYKKGKILVAGPDFGIGSSREHAVWALHDYGFRVVISSRFADIFYGNTAKNGVLAAIMPQESVELLWKLLDEEPGREMTVSLEDRTVTCGDVPKSSRSSRRRCRSSASRSSRSLLRAKVNTRIGRARLPIAALSSRVRRLALQCTASRALP